jgi:hypothetical protein
MPTIDAYGRIVLDADEAFAHLYAGANPDDLLVHPDVADALKALSVVWDRPEGVIPCPPPLDVPPEAFHARRAASWTIGEEYQDIDLREYLTALCTSPEAIARVHEEMDIYEARGLEPLLRAMIALVASLRERKIVWGVGRGSSVASFVLYLIGVHKINSLAYGLSVREFLKD